MKSVQTGYIELEELQFCTLLSNDGIRQSDEIHLIILSSCHLVMLLLRVLTDPGKGTLQLAICPCQIRQWIVGIETIRIGQHPNCCLANQSSLVVCP